MIRRIHTTVLHNAITAPALSTKILAEDFRHSALLVLLTGATTTIKVKVSNFDDVDFSAASTVSNPWYYVDLKGLGDGATTVVGTTGITATTATTQKGYAINVDIAKWIAIDVEALSAGSVSVLLSTATNE